mmetsp:Transcript_26235/g.38395  ORF Transcript_26235/g.38395 Transcript_26235/m.38395 type:complete len:614 (-) Transcript_26235:2012-3853(-)
MKMMEFSLPKPAHNLVSPVIQSKDAAAAAVWCPNKKEQMALSPDKKHAKFAMLDQMLELHDQDDDDDIDNRSMNSMNSIHSYNSLTFGDDLYDDDEDDDSDSDEEDDEDDDSSSTTSESMELSLEHSVDDPAPTTPQHPPQQDKRRVRFHSQDEILDIPNRYDYSEEEVRSMYMSRKEASHARMECHRLLQILESTPGVHFCTRGLEQHGMKYNLKRREVQELQYSVVFKVQNLRIPGLDKAESIAEMLQNLSTQSSAAAHQIGLEDAAAVAELNRTTTTTTSKEEDNKSRKRERRPSIVEIGNSSNIDVSERSWLDNSRRSQSSIPNEPSHYPHPKSPRSHRREDHRRDGGGSCAGSIGSVSSYGSSSRNHFIVGYTPRAQRRDDSSGSSNGSVSSLSSLGSIATLSQRSFQSRTVTKPPVEASMQGIVYFVKFKRETKEFLAGPKIKKDIPKGTYVLVETEHNGMDLGIVRSFVPMDEYYVPSKKSLVNGALARIVKLASQDAVRMWQQNQRDEAKVLETCRAASQRHRLPMTIVDVEYALDKGQLRVYFEAAQRVDFRELVRELCSVCGTRVWMVQLHNHQHASKPIRDREPERNEEEEQEETPIIAPGW